MWDDLVAWAQSPGGARVLQTAIIPAVAILVAGLLAALIARSSVRATIRRAERLEAASVVAGLVAAARMTVDAGDDVPARRRAARLRAEADVRTRLLPLPGAELAADWTAARTDELAQRTADGPATAELAELRDRLVDWVGRPSRARRVFVAPVARPAAPPVPIPAAEPAPTLATPPSDPANPVAEQLAAAAPPAQSDQERFARPAAATGPLRTPTGAEPESESAIQPEPDPVVAGADAPMATAPVAAEELPAWQRTRTVERLQQERNRGRTVEPPADDEDAVPLSTAPVSLPRTHRADAAAAEAEEAIRLEAHQQARHARPVEQPKTGAVAAVTSTPAPAWLDTYDDEAQVTQNLDLKTPPPVAASAVRDRGTPGDDLVPRS